MDESPATATKAAAKKAAPVKKAAKRVVEKGEQRPYMLAVLPDDARPIDRIAFEVLSVRNDLLPSVERIMNNCPDEDTAVQALELFRASLTNAGDPNRNPQVAIAAAIKASGAS